MDLRMGKMLVLSKQTKREVVMKACGQMLHGASHRECMSLLIAGSQTR